jgi:hypothetical protein
MSLRRAPSASVAVDVGGVEQRDAGIERRVHDLAGLVLVEAAAEIVAAEADRGDFQVGGAERAKLHEVIP